jgi:hypothetical protein
MCQRNEILYACGHQKPYGRVPHTYCDKAMNYAIQDFCERGITERLPPLVETSDEVCNECYAEGKKAEDKTQPRQSQSDGVPQ